MVRWCWVNFQCRASYNLDYSRARAYCACSRCGWGWFGHFLLSSILSLLSPSLWKTARHRLKYCLKGPLNPKQPTNQIKFGKKITLNHIRKTLKSAVLQSIFQCHKEYLPRTYILCLWQLYFFQKGKPLTRALRKTDIIVK